MHINVCKETIRTPKFSKQYRRLLKTGINPEPIERVVNLLEQHRNNEIPTDHELHGKMKGMRECHIKGTSMGNNLLLVYQYSNDNLILYLLQIGAHDDILEKLNTQVLKEAYGQSTDLNEFDSQARGRFNTYYKVAIEIQESSEDKQLKYQQELFAFEDAAKTYYNKLIQDTKDGKYNWFHSVVSLSQIDININEDEIISQDIYANEDEEYIEDEDNVIEDDEDIEIK